MSSFLPLGSFILGFIFVAISSVLLSSSCVLTVQDNPFSVSVANMMRLLVCDKFPDHRSWEELGRLPNESVADLANEHDEPRRRVVVPGRLPDKANAAHNDVEMLGKL